MNRSLIKRYESTLLMCLQMLVALPTFSSPQSFTEREFVGTINHTLGIRLKLSKAGTALTGSYSYVKIGKSLRLKGAMDSDVEFHLEESDDAGNQTGKFEGKFVTDDWIEGSWSSKGKKAMPFSAFAVDGKQVPIASQDDRISGQYKRVIAGRLDRNSATLNVWLLKDGRARIQGDAIWVGNAKTGNVNDGEVEDIFEPQGNNAFRTGNAGGGGCSFVVTFGASSLTVSDDTMNCGGLNVTFDGKYRRVGPPKS